MKSEKRFSSAKPSTRETGVTSPRLYDTEGRENLDIDQLSDQQLVALAAERHQGAQMTLYRRYSDRIYGYFICQLHSVHDAEDLTQETFIRALNGLATFRGVASFKNWLYRIAKNQLADFYRDHHAHVLELNEAMPPRSLQKHLEDDELSTNEQRRSLKLLGKVFVNLPQRYKKVLTLRFLKGFSLKETASEMSLSLANAKVLQHRALKMARTKSDSIL